jgi:uridine kinase
MASFLVFARTRGRLDKGSRCRGSGSWSPGGGEKEERGKWNMATQRETRSFDWLSSLLDRLPRRHATLLVGIDGPGGAGKSSFTQGLARIRGDVTVVEMDDFFLPSSARLPGNPRSKPIGADFDWQRLQAQVLAPLNQDQPSWYQRYDWEHDQLAEWHTVPVGGVVLVEGVYATRDELAACYDFTIWLECPAEIRLARGITRNGEGIREIWEQDWVVAEDRYIQRQQPEQRADLIIDSSGQIEHDPSAEFISLGNAE